MSLKEHILNKIKSINDRKLLYELDDLIKQAEGKEPEHANEPTENYLTEKDRRKKAVLKKERSGHNPNVAVKWLEKIAASKTLDQMEDPVEWQKKERRDRRLSLR